MKTIIIMSLLLLSVVLFSCFPPANEFIRPKAGAEQAAAQSATPTTAPAPSSPETTAPPVAPSPASTEPTTISPLASGECQVNADCTEGLLCIDNSCQTITSLYNTACAKKCTVETVDVTTSDGEKYTLARTQGSYTAAGALEWKVGAIPLYCPGEKKLIPFHFLKKTTGKVISEEVVTVEEGKTSLVITHPTVARVKFTVTVDKVKEVC
jgi:hypothetical protein